MNRTFLALLFFLLLSLRTLAQSPTINIQADGDRCADPVLKIDAIVTGGFGSGNVFKARIRKSYNSDVTEIPATLKGGKFEVTIPDNLRGGGESYEIQIMASQPATSSNWSYATYFHIKGRLTISPTLADTINQYKEFSFYLNAVSSSSGYATLIDSSRVDFNPNRDETLQQIRHLYPGKSVTYTIAHAENVCGTMTVGGEAKVYVNPVSVQTTVITPNTACPGSQIRVRFSAGSGTLNANTRYYIRLLESLDAPSRPNAKKYYLDATLKDGELLANIPENLSLSASRIFLVSVVTRNPAIVGDHGVAYLWVNPKPLAEIISSSGTVHPGDGFDITVQYTGPNPYTITLSDGSKVSGSGDVGQTRNLYFKPYPTATKEYSIKSIQASCAPALLSQKKVTATVLPGLIIPEKGVAKEYCEGATVRIPFMANADLPANAHYQMKILFPGDTAVVFAQRTGSAIEFKLPEFKSKFSYPLPRFETFSFQLTSDNPRLVSNTISRITVLGKPDAIWGEPNTQIPVPGLNSFFFQLTGGGRYFITTTDGSTTIAGPYIDSYHAGFNVVKSGEYTLKSISNNCFSNNSPARLSVKVLNEAPAARTISVGLMKYPTCFGDTINMDIATTGQFPEGDEFLIQINKTSSCCEFQTIQTITQTGKIKVVIPYEEKGNISSGEASYTLKVVSVKTGITSENIGLSVQYPFYDLRLAYSNRTSMSGAGSMPVDVRLDYLGATPWWISYSDGKQDHLAAVDDRAYSAQFPVNVKHGTNNFVVKSIRSACGVQNVNLPVSIVVDRYRVSIPPESSHVLYCTGSTIRVPFEVLDTTLVSTSFKLQISKDNITFTDAGPATTSRVAEYQIPAGYPAGRYFMRVISDDNVFSPSFNLEIGSAPTATITVTNHQGTGPIEIEAGHSVFFDITTTGIVPQWLVTEGRYDYELNGNKATVSLYPSKSGEFSVKSISNACGYGPASNTISYKVLPKLALGTLVNTVCLDQGVTFSYDLRGDFDLSDDYIRFSLVSINSNKVFKLDSTRAEKGIPHFQLPEGFEPGNYFIRGTVQKYKLQTDALIQIDGKPRLTLLGNATINAGGQTNLIVKSLNAFQAMSIRYNISNGFSGSLLSSSNSVMVAPQTTTHYQIVSANNQCGNGTIVGDGVTVTVNPPTPRSVETTRWSGMHQNNFICTTDTVQVYFTTTGTFSASNKFVVQLSDSTGLNFKTLATTGSASPLSAVIPGGLTRADGYRLRVIATDREVASADYSNPLPVRHKSTVKFATDRAYLDANNMARAGLIFTGDSPWVVGYTNSKSAFTSNIFLPRDSFLSYDNPAPGEIYTLRSLINGCGPGQVLAPASVTIELVTGTEPTLPSLMAFPNPTRDFVSLNFGKSAKYDVHLYDTSGKLLTSIRTIEPRLDLDLRNYPSGILLLHVESGERKTIFKIVRQ